MFSTRPHCVHGVMRAKEQCHTPPASSLRKRLQRIRVAAEFTEISSAELVPVLGIVAEPLAKFTDRLRFFSAEHRAAKKSSLFHVATTVRCGIRFHPQSVVGRKPTLVESLSFSTHLRSFIALYFQIRSTVRQWVVYTVRSNTRNSSCFDALRGKYLSLDVVLREGYATLGPRTDKSTANAAAKRRLIFFERTCKLRWSENWQSQASFSTIDGGQPKAVIFYRHAKERCRLRPIPQNGFAIRDTKLFYQRPYEDDLVVAIHRCSKSFYRRPSRKAITTTRKLSSAKLTLASFEDCFRKKTPSFSLRPR